MKLIQIFSILVLLALSIVGCTSGDSLNDKLIHELRKKTPDIVKVKMLIENGAIKSGMPPLLMASYTGNIEMVKYLISSGADVNKANKDGFTPLHIAASEGHFEIVQKLINAGSDITKENNKGESCLALAIISVNYQMADSLSAWAPEAVKGQLNLDLDIIGTIWVMFDDKGTRYTITFKSGGLFSYKKDNTSYDHKDETWKLEGYSIRISFNDGDRVYKGTLSGTRMTGYYANKDGMRGTWNATRK